MKILNFIRIQDILDIILVSFIIYRLLLFFKKGGKTGRIVLGLVILLIISLVTKLLGLYTMDWLVQSFWAQVVIILVIIFQPEIRRTLAHMGEASIIGFTTAEEVKSIDEVIKAVVSLSNKKIGALIVFEREVMLNDYVEIGVPLDARVSKELVMSIFHPASPLHDGAIIIRGNRIIAAGCFLPLALGAEISKSYGTRHRAGIGLSEESDAVVVIVSEETGQISLAVDGKLTTNLDMASLRDILSMIFTTKERKRR